MKKLFLLAVIILFASCSSGDSSTESTGILVKKIIQTTDTDTNTTIYQYNGNKLIAAIRENDDFKIVYTYSGNSITDISYQDLDGDEYVHAGYSYDSQGRLKHLSIGNTGTDTPDSADYTYNSDGTISVVTHYFDNGEFEYVTENRKYFLSNGDIVKIETYVSGGTQTATYTYDDKPNPYNNIIGFGKLLDIYSSSHNYISGTVTGDDGSIVQQTDRNITYNGENYPLSVFETGFGDPQTVEYFYE